MYPEISASLSVSLPNLMQDTKPRKISKNKKSQQNLSFIYFSFIIYNIYIKKVITLVTFVMYL